MSRSKKQSHWHVSGNSGNLTRNGWPTSTTHPETTSKELQTSFEVRFHDSTIRKRPGKNGIQEFQGENYRSPKRTQRSHICQEISRYTPKTFVVELFERFESRGRWHKTKQHFIKNIIISQTWWCDGLGLLCCFSTRTSCLTRWNHEFCSLSKNLERQYLSISSCPEA